MSVYAARISRLCYDTFSVVVCVFVSIFSFDVMNL